MSTNITSEYFSHVGAFAAPEQFDPPLLVEEVDQWSDGFESVSRYAYRDNWFAHCERVVADVPDAQARLVIWRDPEAGHLGVITRLEWQGGEGDERLINHSFEGVEVFDLSEGIGLMISHAFNEWRIITYPPQRLEPPAVAYATAPDDWEIG